MTAFLSFYTHPGENFFPGQSSKCDELAVGDNLMAAVAAVNGTVKKVGYREEDS